MSTLTIVIAAAVLWAAVALLALALCVAAARADEFAARLRAAERREGDD